MSRSRSWAALGWRPPTGRHDTIRACARRSGSLDQWRLAAGERRGRWPLAIRGSPVKFSTGARGPPLWRPRPRPRGRNICMHTHPRLPAAAPAPTGRHTKNQATGVRRAAVAVLRICRPDQPIDRARRSPVSAGAAAVTLTRSGRVEARPCPCVLINGQPAAGRAVHTAGSGQEGTAASRALHEHPIRDATSLRCGTHSEEEAQAFEI